MCGYISHDVNQWCGTHDIGWRMIPIILCVEIVLSYAIEGWYDNKPTQNNYVILIVIDHLINGHFKAFSNLTLISIIEGVIHNWFVNKRV